MKNLTLDYLFKRGGKLAPGDVYEFGGQLTTVTKEHLTLANTPQPFDNERFIKSFAPRKNSDTDEWINGFPIVGGDGWWMIDPEALTKQQTETKKMDKLTSDQIDWQKDDVMIILEVGTNKELNRYSNAAHHEDSCVHYSVMRDAEVVKVKGVRDAVIEFKGEWTGRDDTEGPMIVLCIENDSLHFGGSAYREDLFRFICTKKEFISEVKAMSNFAGLHEHLLYVDLLRERDEVKPAAEWSNGDDCTFENKGGKKEDCTVIGLLPPHKETYVLHKKSSPDSAPLFISNINHMSKPETRTPEQIKIQKLSDYLEANQGVATEDLAREILSEFCEVAG